jgi:cytochrome b561
MIRNKLLWKNTKQQYGLVSKGLHWLSAITVFILFGLGYWMVELDYYSEWYQRAPHWHESIGLLLFVVTLLRLGWKAIVIKPEAISGHSRVEKKASAIMTFTLYFILLTVLASGYLITSADGKAIAVFDWFTVSAFVLIAENQEDLAGAIHYYIAYILIFIALAHALAALKHHFIDKDNTLKRMTK